MVVQMDDVSYWISVGQYAVIAFIIPCILFFMKSRDGVQLLFARLRNVTLLRVHWGDGYETLETAKKMGDEYMFYIRAGFMKPPIPYRIDSGLFETGKMSRRDGVRIVDYYIGSAYPVGDMEAKAVELSVEYIRQRPQEYMWLSSIEKDVTLMTVLCMSRDKLIQNRTKYIRLDTTTAKDQKEVERLRRVAADQLVEEARKARIALSKQRMQEGPFTYHVASMAINNPFTITIIKKMESEMTKMYEDKAANQERTLKIALGFTIVVMAGALAYYIASMGGK